MDSRHHVIPALASRSHIVMTEPELVQWGERLGADVHAPLVIALTGEMGTGKTTLTQAICRGYGVRGPVTSPTYAIVHEYDGARTPVYHVDLYRLEREADLEQLGWSDIVSANALVIVEWPERAGRHLPSDHLPITLDYEPGDELRRMLLAG